MPQHLLAIDPGNDTGAALFTKDGLVKAILGDPKTEWPTLPDQTVVIIERPRIYPHSKVPPNDILTLAWGAGGYAMRYRDLGHRVHEVEPATWKGQVPKETHHGQMLSRLAPEDRKAVFAMIDIYPKGKRHNVLDAVCLGIYGVKVLLK